MTDDQLHHPSGHDPDRPVVLVVGEVGELRDAFAKRLLTAGFEVIEATDAEAERVMKSVAVDAVLFSVRR